MRSKVAVRECRRDAENCCGPGFPPFMGGSLIWGGMAAVRRSSPAANMARERGTPFVALCASGGAPACRKASLLADEDAAHGGGAAALREARLPISSCSPIHHRRRSPPLMPCLAMCICRSPAALDRLLRPRVIEQTIREKAAGSFQRAEYLKDHGMSTWWCRARS